MSKKGIERSASVDSPSKPKLQGEVSFGDNSPLFGVLPPSQRHALHLSLTAAAQEASGKERMPLNLDFVEKRIAEGKTAWIQELRRDHLLQTCEHLRINVSEEYTVDELRTALREFVKSKTREQVPPQQIQNAAANQPPINMAEDTPTVRQVLKDIEIFDSSDRGKVCDFIRSCKYARRIIRPTDTEDLLEAVLSTRIKGAPARALEYKSIDTWNALEEELKSMSIDTRTLASLQVEYSSCRQRHNEDARSYGARVERLTAQVIEVTMREADEGDSKPTLERQVRKQAVNIFIRGLNDKLRILVKSRRCENLREAISIAIEEERDLGPIRGSDREYSQPRSSRDGNRGNNCYNCGKPGHVARDCRSARTGSSSSQRLPTPSGYVRKIQVICHFCKKPGHFIRDCRTRLAEENRRGYERNRGPPRREEQVQPGPSRDASRRDEETSGNEEQARRTGNRIASYQ